MTRFFQTVPGSQPEKMIVEAFSLLRAVPEILNDMK